MDDRVLATVAELEARLARLLAHLQDAGTASASSAGPAGALPALGATMRPAEPGPAGVGAPPSSLPAQPGVAAVPVERLEAFARRMSAVFDELAAHLAGLMAPSPSPGASSDLEDLAPAPADGTESPSARCDGDLLENAAALSAPASGAPPVYAARGPAHAPRDAVAATRSPQVPDLAHPSTHDQVFDGLLVVDAGPFAQIADLRNFEAAVQSAAAGGSVYLRSFMADRALIDVDLPQPLRLGRELRAILPYPFALFESSEGRVTINVDPVGSR